jgi:C4-type Zn-finger protein
MDHADEVHHECPVCESDIWIVKAIFEDYDLAVYFLDMECASCGSYAKAPTPLDRPSLT